MISWRTARIFLLCLASIAVFVVMLAGVSDLPYFVPLRGTSRGEKLPEVVPSKTAPRPFVYPMVVIPKDTPSIFAEV